MGLRDYARRNNPTQTMWKLKSRPRSPKHMSYRGRKIRYIRTKHDLRMMKAGFAARSLLGFTPYVLGGAVSYAARSDGPSVFEGSPFIVSDVPAAAQDAPSSWYRRTSGSLDDLMEEYYFG